MNWTLERKHKEARILLYFLFLWKNQAQTAHERTLTVELFLLLQEWLWEIMLDVEENEKRLCSAIFKCSVFFSMSWITHKPDSWICQTQYKHHSPVVSIQRHLPYSLLLKHFWLPKSYTYVSRQAWSPWESRFKPIQIVPCQAQKEIFKKNYYQFVSREHLLGGRNRTAIHIALFPTVGICGHL